MAIFKVINSGSAVRGLYLSTVSKLPVWKAPYVVNNGSTLTWRVSNGYTATLTGNTPIFNLSTNTGNANMAITNANAITSFHVNNLSVHWIMVTDVPALEDLVISTNLISNLVVTNNINLKILSCFTNLLTALILTTNTLLEYLDASNNNIAVLDISNNPLLTSLKCYGNNQATSVTNKIFIDLDTHNKSNGELHIRNNADGLGLTARANLITKGWTIVDSYTT